MTLIEAVNTVCLYLHRQQAIVFTLAHAQQLAEEHFQVAIHQNLPEDKQRIFDVLPEDVPDCWKVVEVNAA